MNRIVDSAVLSWNAATVDGNTDRRDFSWFVPHYMPSIIQQDLMNEHTMNKFLIHFGEEELVLQKLYSNRYKIISNW